MQISNLQKYSFFFLFVILPPSGQHLVAQSFLEKTDSLLQLLSTTQEDLKRVDLLNDLAFEFRRSSPDSMLLYTQQALALAQEQKYAYGLMLAHKHLGIYQYKLEYPTDSILISYEKALSYANSINDEYQQAALANNIALVKSTQNKFKESIRYLLQGLNQLSKSSQAPTRLEALMNANISTSYNRLNNLEKAKLYLEKAFVIASEISDKTIPSIFGDDYGSILIGLGKKVEGMEHLLAITQTQENLHDYQSLCQTYAEIAKQHLQQNELDKAEKFALLSENTAKTHGFTASLTRIDLILSQIATLKKQYDIAIDYGLQALNSARYTSKYYEEKKAYSVLTEAYYGKGEFEIAFQMQKSFLDIQERIAETEKLILTEELEAQFQLSEQQKEIAMLNERQDLQNRRIKLLIIISVLIVFLLIALSVAYLITRRSKEIISYKNQQLKTYIDQNLQLENFVHIASHDLKSPLRNITSFSQLLKRKVAIHPDESVKEYLHYIIKASNEMSALVEDLLQYSIINKKSINLAPVSTEQLLTNVQIGLQDIITETATKVDTDLAIKTIMVDPAKLEQVLHNLIVNAIKFRHPDKAPRINIALSEKDDHWFFTVKDNGIGIQEEYQEQIFIVLKRLHDSSKYEGTGMGLPICKVIIEQHGGEIGVVSTLGQGSKFFFTIPKLPLTNQQNAIL